MGRRTLLLITSLLIATVGTALVALYVRGADQRAIASVDSTRVLIANADITVGSTVARVRGASGYGAVFAREIEKGSTIQTPRQLTELGTKVLKVPVYKGQVIDARMFRDAADAASGVQDLVPAGHSMVAVQMADPNRVAAYLQPQTEVAVFLTTGQAGTADRKNQLLVPKVTVIAVGDPVVSSTSGARTGAGAGDTVPKTVVTLDVDNQKSAQKLFLAQTSGDLYFAVLGKGTNMQEGPAVTSEGLFAP